MERLVAAVWAVLGMAVSLVWAATSSFFIWPTAVLPRGRRERYAAFGMRYFAWCVLRFSLLARETVIGRERLPRTPGYLVVSNHRSWVDVGMLQLYTNSQGVSKKEVAYIPFFGVNGYLTGAIFFDRRDPNARARVVEEAMTILGGGGNLHVFPEGTRTRDGRLNPKVHLRLLIAASERGFPLVPVCVWDTDRAIPAEGIYVMPLRRFGLEIGAPVPRQPGQTAEDHARAVWAEVQAMAARHGADRPFTA